MSEPDFGPIPVSRLKGESGHIFAALGQGRRVLISRRGQVVAAIDPATVERYPEELARFALPGEQHMDELTASDLSQGSPSEAVRAAAEDGVSSYVTRNSKVYGVLSGLPVASPEDAAGYTYWVDERERAMTSFEADHPDATAEQFAAFVAAYPEFQNSAQAADAFDHARPSAGELNLAPARARQDVLYEAMNPGPPPSDRVLRTLLDRSESLQQELREITADLAAVLARSALSSAVAAPESRR
ncbi:MAG: hypothetical protein V9G19_14540 [Tetrasphaera sp.]